MLIRFSSCTPTKAEPAWFDWNEEDEAELKLQQDEFERNVLITILLVLLMKLAYPWFSPQASEADKAYILCIAAVAGLLKDANVLCDVAALNLRKRIAHRV